jgi:hypothetical protein
MKQLSAIFLTLLLAFTANGWSVPHVDQVARWNAAEVRPENRMALDKLVFLYQRTQSRYEAIEKLRSDGVPDMVLFCLHYRGSRRPTDAPEQARARWSHPEH